MQLASLAAQRSNCMKRRVGCVLVREKRVVSTGYNGTPRNLKNCNAGGCAFTGSPISWIVLTTPGPRCNSGQKAGIDLSTCLCLHAEENALLEAGRERIREGSILYCDTYAVRTMLCGMNSLRDDQMPLLDMQCQDNSSRHLGSGLLSALRHG